MNDRRNPYVRMNLYRSLACMFSAPVSMNTIAECLTLPIEIVRDDMLKLCWSDFDFIMCPIIDLDDGQTSTMEYKLVERDHDEPVTSDLEGKIAEEFRSDYKIDTSMQNLIKNGAMDSFQMINFLQNPPDRVFLSLSPDEYELMNLFMEGQKDSAKLCNLENNMVKIKNEFQYLCYDDVDENKNKDIRQIKLREASLHGYEHSIQEMVRDEKICQITYRFVNESKTVICRPLCITYEINSVEAAIAVLTYTENGYQFIKMEQVEELKDCTGLPLDSKIDDNLKKKTGKKDIHEALDALHSEISEWLPHQWGFCNYENEEEREKDSCKVKVKFFNHGNVFEKLQKDLMKRKGSLKPGKVADGNEIDTMIYEDEIIGKDAFLRWLLSYGASALLMSTDEDCNVTLMDRMKAEFEKLRNLYAKESYN